MAMLRPGFLAIVSGLFLIGTPDTVFAQCSQTLSVGSNIASAVAGAPNGATICLNSGNYGRLDLVNISRSGFVTLRSTSGISAQLSPVVGNSRFIKFDSLTLTDGLVNSCSSNVEFWNSTFLPNADGLVFNYDTACSGISDMALVVDNVTFDRVGQANFEGRLSIRGARGLTIRNSRFTGVSTSNASDGIQIIGGSQNLVIGPGNVFSGILQSQCGATHCDAIQDYGGGPNNRITGNRFESGDTFIMMPDGTNSYRVENNIFNGSGASYIDKIQFGSANNPIFRHNTLVNVRASFDSKTGSAASTNVIAENNILISGSSWKTSNGSGCSNCTFRYNLFSQNATGTNNLIGTPTFIGGTLPSTWAGWQLTAQSLGKNAGNDGNDMGTNYYGTAVAPVPAPAAPTNVHITSGV